MLELRKAGYRFPLASGWALSDLDLRVGPAERVLLCGRSGSGKSTLLRLASGLLELHGGGAVGGEVRLDGLDPGELSPRVRAGMVGFVGQEPAEQLVAGTVVDEVAFGLELQGLAPTEIDRRVRRSLDRVGLQVDPSRDPRTLSGGQQQRVALAAALAGGARLLLLDEPLARLDPPGAVALLELLGALAEEGVAVVLAEHRLDPCLGWAGRVVVLDGGRLVHDVAVEAAPQVVASAGLLRSTEPVVLPEVGGPVLDAGELTVRYGDRVAVRGVQIALRRGERLAVVGPNGAGKSSLLGALSGRLAPKIEGLLVMEVPQDPALALFCPTVREELSYGPREQGLGAEAIAHRLGAVVGPLGLELLLDRPPQGLSGGERLRVAVGAALTCGPDVLLLDEPTAGQDARSVRGLLQALGAAAPEAAVVFATHDQRLAEEAAHRIVHLRAGAVADRGPVRAADPEKPGTGTGPGTGLDPRTRLALLAAVGVLAVLLDRPASLAALAAVSGAVLLASPAAAGWRWRAVALSAALIWSTVLSQGLFYGELPRVAWVEIGPIRLWREGVWHGLAQSLRMLAAAYAGVAVAVSTPADRLVVGLGALRIPWSVGLLASIALRGVPAAAEAWAAVRRARSARGRPVWSRTPWAWLALEASMLQPVAARAIRSARALALSLDARGFDPEAERSHRRPLSFRLVDRGILGLAGAGVGCAVCVELLYRAYLAEVLYLPMLRPVYGWARAWL